MPNTKFRHTIPIIAAEDDDEDVTTPLVIATATICRRIYV
jgi:hypothetical protein